MDGYDGGGGGGARSKPSSYCLPGPAGLDDVGLEVEPRPSPGESPALRESLRRLRPPGLERMLSASRPANSAVEDEDVERTVSGSPLRRPRRPAAETFLRRRSAPVVTGWSVGGIGQGTHRPGRLDQLLDDTVRNQPMLLHEAISESLRSTHGPGSNNGSRESMSPELEAASYSPASLHEYSDHVTPSKLPINVKELHMQLKAAKDECFTLKLSLHFLEEDYKRGLGAEDLTRENVNLKVEVCRLKEIISKKDDLLHKALTVLQNCDNSQLGDKEAEGTVERRAMEKKIQEAEQKVTELERRLQACKCERNENNVSSKRDSSENLDKTKFTSLHCTISEKDDLVQRLFLERDKLLELVSSCSDKSFDFSKLKFICKKTLKEEMVNNVTLYNNNNKNNDTNNNSLRDCSRFNDESQEMMKLVAQVQQLKSELKETKKEKLRVMTEAQIMDQNQQELSEKVTCLNLEVRKLTQQKHELEACLFAHECTDGKAHSSDSNHSRTSEDERARFLEEVKRLREESSEKEYRLQVALGELRELRKRRQEHCNERAVTKLTSTKSMSRCLFEPKIHQSSSSSRSDQESSGQSPKEFSSGSSCPKEASFLNQSLEGLSVEQLQERVLQVEAICLSMQSHLEDMADFFSSLLATGDLNRLEGTLSPADVSKLRSLVDRTVSISLSISNNTSGNLSDYLSDLTTSVIREDEISSKSSGNVGSKNITSSSDTHSSSLLGKSCKKKQGQSGSSRLSWSSDQLAPSLVQGLLEVLRRTERSGQKLCSELNSFHHSHLYKLLVEGLLKKLKDRKFLQGSMPGQEWIEVSQELESFHRKCQEVIQAAALSQGWLKQGLDHLTKKCLSTKTSPKPEEMLKCRGTSKSSEDCAPHLDRTWVVTTVDAHRDLALMLEGQVQQLCLGDENPVTQGTSNCGKLLRDLCGIWGRREDCQDTAVWYRDKLLCVPQALALLQQVLQKVFCVLSENHQEMKECLKKLETTRLNELQSAQEWNDKLQTEQKSQETLLEALRAKETELAQKVLEREEEIGKLLSRSKRNDEIQDLTCQLDTAKSDLEISVSKQQSMNKKIVVLDCEIEKLATELELKEGAVQKLSCKLDSTYAELEVVGEREKKISDSLNKALHAKADLENTVRSLKCVLQKQTEEKLEMDLNFKLHLETATASLNKKLDEAMSKLDLSETREQEMIIKLTIQDDEIQRLNLKSNADDKQLENSKLKLLEMDDYINNQVSEIEKLSFELKTERMSTKRLYDEVNDTKSKLKDLMEQLTIVTNLKNKAVDAKEKMEAYVAHLGSEVHKENIKKYKQELKCLKSQLEAALVELKKSEEQSSILQEEVVKMQDKLENSESEWTQKINHEQRERVQIEKEMQQACQTIDAQSRECSEATSKAAKLDEQLKLLSLQLENAKAESQNRFQELEEVHFRLKLLQTELQNAKECLKRSAEEVKASYLKEKTLRNELKSARNELDAATRDLRRLKFECQRLQKGLSEKGALREVAKPVKELATKSHQQLHEVRGHKGSPLETDMKWKVKIETLERDAARLRQEVQESYHMNQELKKQVANYEKNTSAILQKPAAIRLNNHSSSLGQIRCKHCSNGKQGSGGNQHMLTDSSSNPTTSSEDLCYYSGHNGSISNKSHISSTSSPCSLTTVEKQSKNPLFKYECSLVPILAPVSNDVCSGDAKDSILQRSNYSSPDLGIESDPCYVSSYSSSTSSSESCPPNPDSTHQRHRIVSGKGAHKNDASFQTKTYGKDFLEFQKERAALCDVQLTSPEGVIHRMCPLQDLGKLRQELEQALVALQRTRRSLSSRMDRSKNSDCATLHELDSYCEQILEHLNRWKDSVDSFSNVSLSTSTLGPVSPQSCISSPASGHRQLSDSSQLISACSSVNTVLYNAATQDDDPGALKSQVLGLKTKLQDLESLYLKAVEEITANKSKAELMNRALVKQLSATTSVLRKAKANLKQNESLMYYKPFEAIMNKCS